MIPLKCLLPLKWFSSFSDEYAVRHASGIDIGGRIVLNLWKLFKSEIKASNPQSLHACSAHVTFHCVLGWLSASCPRSPQLNIYTLENVALAVLRRRMPHYPQQLLLRWYNATVATVAHAAAADATASLGQGQQHQPPPSDPSEWTLPACCFACPLHVLLSGFSTQQRSCVCIQWCSGAERWRPVARPAVPRTTACLLTHFMLSCVAALVRQVDRCRANIDILDALDLIGRTSEVGRVAAASLLVDIGFRADTLVWWCSFAQMARVFGIKFFDVLFRGSQFRVESMMVRLARPQDFLLPALSKGGEPRSCSPTVLTALVCCLLCTEQVAAQAAMECIPLVCAQLSA